MESPTKPKQIFPLLISILIIAALLYFLIRPTPTPPIPTQLPASPSPAQSTSTIDNPNLVPEPPIKSFTLEAGSFYYQPNIIRVQQGDTVKLIINSVDMIHDLVIDEFAVSTDLIKSGETAEVTFTADRVGEFEFYCSVGSHRAAGMIGTLIVE